MDREIVIIGAGPAGIACAMQLRRQGMNPLVIEKTEPGALLANAGLIENYPGFPGGITGPDLQSLFERQFYACRPEVEHGKVEKLDYIREQEHFVIETDRGGHQARLVVVASGSRPKKIHELEALPHGLRNGVCYEISALLQMEKKHIVVVGGGDIALDYALNLSRLHQVVLLCRSPEFKGLPLLRERIASATRIRSFRHARLLRLEPGRERALSVHAEQNGQPMEAEADYLVCAVGREADKHFYTPRLSELEEHLIRQARLFLAGDVHSDRLRQIAIAAGDGLSVAMRIAENKLLTVLK